MPRLLSDKPCKVTFADNLAGGNITLEYRMPTTEERISYTNGQISRHGRKVESIMGNTRMKFGAKILTGITDGEFQKDDGKALSSRQDSPDYDAGWKALVEKFAPDVVAMLAMHVFENALTMSDQGDEGDDKDPS